VQPGGELRARKAKENQAKILGFDLVLFGRIWAFQRVTVEKIKKSKSFELASQVVRRAPLTKSAGSLRLLAVIPGGPKV
jgi:DNA-binding IclR family transcriptional regulator